MPKGTQDLNFLRWIGSNICQIQPCHSKQTSSNLLQILYKPWNHVVSLICVQYVSNMKAGSVLLKVGGYEICISEGIHSSGARLIPLFFARAGEEEFWECFLFVLKKGKSKIFNVEKARNEWMIMKEFEKCCRTLKKDEERVEVIGLQLTLNIFLIFPL